MGISIDWTLKMKSRTGSPLRPDHCAAVLYDLYHYIGYIPSHLCNESEYETSFETGSNYADEDIPKLLKDITREFPDVIMQFTCKAEPWDYAEKANVSRGELEWLSATLVYAEPRIVFY